jgi:hypothetical protein
MGLPTVWQCQQRVGHLAHGDCQNAASAQSEVQRTHFAHIITLKSDHPVHLRVSIVHGGCNTSLVHLVITLLITLRQTAYLED